jgi:hypothetical protein
MINALTRSRSPEFHRATMLRLTIAALLLWGFWGTLYPVRSVTADLLDTTADFLRR